MPGHQTVVHTDSTQTHTEAHIIGHKLISESLLSYQTHECHIRLITVISDSVKVARYECSGVTNSLYWSDHVKNHLCVAILRWPTYCWRQEPYRCYIAKGPATWCLTIVILDSSVSYQTNHGHIRLITVISDSPESHRTPLSHIRLITVISDSGVSYRTYQCHIRLISIREQSSPLCPESSRALESLPLAGLTHTNIDISTAALHTHVHQNSTDTSQSAAVTWYCSVYIGQCAHVSVELHFTKHHSLSPINLGCLGGTAVRALDFRSSGRGFASQPGRNQGT